MYLVYSSTSRNILSFVKSTDGRYFLTTGSTVTTGSYLGNPDTPVSTTNFAIPFFYELKFNNDYTTASLIPIYLPLTVVDPSTACIEGQVSLLSLKDNKLAVLFGVDQVYIYDINTGTFLEINSQAKYTSGSSLNSTGGRTVNQNKMAYDHINNKLYVVTSNVWGSQEINYIIYDMVKGVKQNLVLSRSDAKHSNYYYFFFSIFFKDGSLFGRIILNNNAPNRPLAQGCLSYKHTDSSFVYIRGGTNNYYVKSFGLNTGVSYITTFGHRYDEIIHSLNNLTEMTTKNHHMCYSYTNIYYSTAPVRSEEYMFRIF